MELNTVALAAQLTTSYTTTCVSISAQKDSSPTKTLVPVTHVTTLVLVVLNLPNNVVVVKKVSSYTVKCV